MKILLTPNRFYVRIILFAYLAIGLTLILQPNRYANTPSYGNLIDVLPQWAWGAIYVGVSLLLTAARLTANRVVGVVSHTTAISLTAAWLIAFVIRYLTDEGTTIVNVVSWGVFLTILIISLFHLSDKFVEVPVAPLATEDKNVEK
jgi:hypothetical protein